MTEQGLIDAGYRLYQGGAATFKRADRYYAKMMTDDTGKKFQMVIYVYDWRGQEGVLRGQEISFMPDVQISDDGELCVDVTLHNRPEFTIELIEQYYTDLWAYHGSPYIEKWGE